MDNLGLFITLIGLIGVVVFALMALLSFANKNGKGKTNLKRAGLSFAAMVVGFIMFGIFSPDTEVASTESNQPKEEAKKEEKKKEETPEEKAEREAKEKAAAEQKAKEEAERKAKEEAEAKAKAEAEAKAKAEAEKKAQEEAAAKKANAKPIEYAQLKKNPDRYAGEYVKYTGEIIQIMEGDNVTQIRLAVTKDSYGYDVNDIIFVEYAGLTEFVEEDVITVYGEIYGEYSYTSQAGWEISLPGLLAESIE